MDGGSQNRQRHLGVLALATIAPIWGYSWVVSKVALGYARPFTLAALVTTSCALFLMLVVWAAGRPLRPPPLGWTIAIGLLQTALFNGLATLALNSTGAGEASVLAYTMSFWLLLLAWLVLGERLNGLQWPAVGLAFAGLVLVVRPWDISGASSGILACASGLAWAAGALLVKLLQRRAHADTLSLTAWQMLFGAVPLVVVAVVTKSGWPQWTGVFVACFAYAVFVSNAVCWALWVFALRALPTGAAGMGVLAVPVIGATSSWIQLGERPAALEAAGMALIVVALALLAVHGVLAGRRAQGATDGELVPPPVID